MTKTAVAEKVELPTAEKPLEIRPSALTWQYRGFAYSVAQVLLPPWAETADKLRANSAAWMPVQNNPNSALSRLDEVRLIAHDELWIAHAVVEDADRHRVKLAIGRVVALEGRTSKWSDGETEIRWSNGGYRAFRVRDGVLVMANMSFQTLDQARLELARLTPTQLGGRVG